MRALVGVAVAGLVLGLAALALVLTGDHDTITGPFVVLALTLGWSFIGTGLYALWRRPDQPIGRLMMLVGFLWFVGRAAGVRRRRSSTRSASRSAGCGPARSCTCWSRSRRGRSRPGSSGGVVRLAYALALLQPLALLFDRGARTPDCHGCPENLLLVVDSPAVVDVVTTLLGRRRRGDARGRLRRARAALAALRAGAAARAGAGAVDRRGDRGRRRGRA